MSNTSIMREEMEMAEKFRSLIDGLEKCWTGNITVMIQTRTPNGKC